VLRLHAQVYSFPAKLWKILKNVQIVHEKVIDLDVKYLFAIIYIYVFQAFTIFLFIDWMMPEQMSLLPIYFLLLLQNE